MKKYTNSRGFIQVTLVENIESEDAGLVFSIYAPPGRDQTTRQPVDLNVFASSSSEHLISEDKWYLENLFAGDRVMYLKLDH